MKSRLEPSCRLSGGLQSLHPGARRWLWRPDLEVETSNLATIFFVRYAGVTSDAESPFGKHQRQVSG
jgi:hypothetical protein